jgi:hypothetical protein
MSAEDFTDPHWVDEFPESVECGWCGFIECACDELEDIHDFGQEMMGVDE